MPQADADLVVTLQADPAGPCLITVSGELDYHTGPRLRACLEEAPLGPGAALVLDLAGLTYCDSIGVAVLVHGYRRAEAAGAKLALAGTPADTFRLLRLTGLDRLFTTYDSVDAAIGALLPEPGDRDHLLQPDVRPGDPDPPLLHRTGGIPYGRATAGFNGTPDCGVTFIGPGTFNLTATLAWKTCWVPEAVDGPPPANCTPVPGAELNPDAWTRAVTMHKIQSANGASWPSAPVKDSVATTGAGAAYSAV